MKKTLAILFFVFLSTPCLVSFQSDFNARARKQSIFLYNFASKYIEWPASYKDGSFIIGVLGDPPIYKDLGVVTAGKKAFNQNIEIKKFNSPAEIGKCNMLFIPYDKSDAIQEAVSKVKNGSTLVITEKDGVLKQGAIINFINKDGSIKFETNKTEIEKRDIKIAADLLKLSVNTI